MGRPKTNGRNLGQAARIVIHKEEHLIIRTMLLKALGDDDCFERIVASELSKPRRAEHRLVLAGFLARMERQFELRADAEGHAHRKSNGHDLVLSDTAV